LYRVTIVENGDPVTSFETSVTTPALQLTLDQNHPNPFNPRTRIDYRIDRTRPVHLAVYDISGRVVRVLVDRNMHAGVYTETWDGRDTRGREVASGVYFYRLRAGTITLSRKATLLK
jgi:hypothetical protein